MCGVPCWQPLPYNGRSTKATQTADPERLELTVRIGIHTGPVVFGPVADNLPMDYTVIGDTANVAARLRASRRAGNDPR